MWPARRETRQLRLASVPALGLLQRKRSPNVPLHVWCWLSFPLQVGLEDSIWLWHNHSQTGKPTQPRFRISFHNAHKMECLDQGSPNLFTQGATCVDLFSEIIVVYYYCFAWTLTLNLEQKTWRLRACAFCLCLCISFLCIWHCETEQLQMHISCVYQGMYVYVCIQSDDWHCSIVIGYTVHACVFAEWQFKFD